MSTLAHAGMLPITSTLHKQYLLIMICYPLLQAEKKQAKEFEELAERKRLEFLKNAEKSQAEHNSVTRIALLYRRSKALR